MAMSIITRALKLAGLAVCTAGVAGAFALPVMAAGGSSGSGHGSGKSAGQAITLPKIRGQVVTKPVTTPPIKQQPIDPAPPAIKPPSTAELVQRHLDSTVTPLLKRDLPPFKGDGDGPRGGVFSKEQAYRGPSAVEREVPPPVAPPPYRSIIRKRPTGGLAI